MRTIGLASTSGRRLEAMRAIPDIDVVAVGGGPENQTQDLLTIALEKITFAYPTIVEILSNDNRALAGVVGADTGTAPHMLVEDSYVHDSQAKPESLAVVRDNFRGMAALSDITGAGYYEVASSSAFQDENGTAAGTQVTKVFLEKEQLKALTTDEGFQRYLEVFQAFYESEAYVSKGLSNVTPQDLSGGLSLPVFLKMGMVEKLDGKRLAELKAAEKERVVSLAILNVAVGFAPQVLHRIHENSLAELLKWSWLEQVVAESLDTIK